MTDPVADLEHNLRAPLVTLEAVRAANPRAVVVFASTRQVYGTPASLPVTEVHPVRPVDVNGVHKAAAEQLHALYARVHGLRTVSVRLTNVYGPRQVIGHDRHGFIGWWVRLVLEDRPITVFGDGAQRRDFCFVRDAAEGLWRVAGAPFVAGEAYNLAGPTVASLAELADLMCAIAGKGRVERVPFPPEKRAIAVGDCVVDGGRLASLLGWRPVVALEAGLRDTFAYFGPCWRRYVEGT
jgi:UDP-glucose 4-epimerase